jgi:hypothetical protein
VHFFALPILMINAIVTIVQLAHTPSLGTAWQVVVAIALVSVVLSMRWMANRLQDRMIRHEERTRIARLLPEGERSVADALTLNQLIGLRFAPDGEVVALVRRCASGELMTRDNVKRAITTWLPDNLRV